MVLPARTIAADEGDVVRDLAELLCVPVFEHAEVCQARVEPIELDEPDGCLHVRQLEVETETGWWSAPPVPRVARP